MLCLNEGQNNNNSSFKTLHFLQYYANPTPGCSLRARLLQRREKPEVGRDKRHAWLCCTAHPQHLPSTSETAVRYTQVFLGEGAFSLPSFATKLCYYVSLSIHLYRETDYIEYRYQYTLIYVTQNIQTLILCWYGLAGSKIFLTISFKCLQYVLRFPLVLAIGTNHVHRFIHY